MLTQDTVEIAKKIINDPLPYINGGVFLGMNALDWDLAMKVVIGFGTIVFTWIKVWYEWRKLQTTKSKDESDDESEV